MTQRPVIPPSDDHRGWEGVAYGLALLVTAFVVMVFLVGGWR